MTALEWPKVLVPPTVDIHYDARTISGGVSLSGKEQIASRDFGIWRATLERVAIRRRDQVLAWRALLIALDGRAGTVLVPLFDRARAPYPPKPTPSPIGQSFVATFFKEWPDLRNTAFQYEAISGASGVAVVTAANSVSITGSVVESGAYAMIDGTFRRLTDITPVSVGTYKAVVSPGFDLSPIVTGEISATVFEAAPARSPAVTISISEGSIPEPGMHFSIGNRAYRIRAVTNVAGSVVTCNIRPGLREAVAADAPVNFTSPVCEMRLTSDDQGRAGLDMWKFASPSFEFIEA